MNARRVELEAMGQARDGDVVTLARSIDATRPTGQRSSRTESRSAHTDPDRAAKDAFAVREDWNSDRIDDATNMPEANRARQGKIRESHRPGAAVDGMRPMPDSPSGSHARGHRSMNRCPMASRHLRIPRRLITSRYFFRSCSRRYFSRLDLLETIISSPRRLAWSLACVLK